MGGETPGSRIKNRGSGTLDGENKRREKKGSWKKIAKEKKKTKMRGMRKRRDNGQKHFTQAGSKKKRRLPETEKKTQL